MFSTDSFSMSKHCRTSANAAMLVHVPVIARAALPRPNLHAQFARMAVLALLVAAPVATTARAARSK